MKNPFALLIRRWWVVILASFTSTGALAAIQKPLCEYEILVKKMTNSVEKFDEANDGRFVKYFMSLTLTTRILYHVQNHNELPQPQHEAEVISGTVDMLKNSFEDMDTITNLFSFLLPESRQQQNKKFTQVLLKTLHAEKESLDEVGVDAYLDSFVSTYSADLN